MKEAYARLTHSGAHALTLGLLTHVFGVTVGVLCIVNGEKLLHQARKIR